MPQLMSPEEWLASQNGGAKSTILSPEEWLAQQSGGGNKILGPEEWLKQQEPKPEDQSVFRQVADVPLEVTQGFVTGVRMISDAFGANNPVSKALKGGEDYIGSLLSAQSKQDSQEIARIMDEAKNKGVWDQVKAGVKALTVAPVDLISNALGTSGPMLVGALGSEVLGGGALAVRGAGALLGAATGAGAVKGSIYDSVKEELEKTGMPPEQVEARAKLAQQYNGKNLDMILAGTALGGLEAVTGMQGSVARQAARRIMGKEADAAADAAAAQAVQDQLKKTVQRGALKQAGISGAEEFGTEFGQSAQQQIAQNLALQREGFDTPLMQGVVGQATLEGLAGFGLGAPTGAREVGHARAQLNQQEQDVADKAAKQVEAERAQLVALGEKQSLTPEEKTEYQKLQTIYAPVEEKTTAGVTVDEAYVHQIASDLVSKGVDPKDAREEAVKIATEEAENDATYEKQNQGVQSVAGPNAEPVGTSNAMAGQPGQVEPAAGIEGPQRNGVVPVGQNVSVSNAGESQQPTAVTSEETPAAPTAPQEVVNETPQEQPAPTAETPTEVVTEPAPAAAVEEPSAVSPTEEVTEGPAKRGRKPLPPEVKQARETERKDSRAKFQAAQRRFSQNKESALNQLAEANKPLDEGEFEDEEALAQAREDKRAQKAAAINQLLDIEQEQRGTALGERVKAVLNDRTKISQAEIDKVKKGREVRAKTDLRGELKTSTPLANRRSTGKADSKFGAFSNGAQALTHIINTTTNPFQKFLARRLRAFVGGVKFVVIEKGDALPAQLQEHAADWEDSRGLFFAGTKISKPTVYVRGASFGEDQGVNNITVLHELLHAATNAKINLAMLAGAKGISTDAALTRFVGELNALMENAKINYERMLARGMIPPELRVLVESAGEVDPKTGKVTSDIFELPQEFLAYGMSDEHFQDFLDSIEGRSSEESGWSRFTRMIANLFGLGRGNYTALSDLMHITDSILTSPKTKAMRNMEAGTEEKVSAQAKAKTTKTDKLVEKITTSKVGAGPQPGIMDAIRELVTTRDNTLMTDVLASRFKDWRAEALKQLLPALQSETLVDWANKLGMTNIGKAWDTIADMNGMRVKKTAEAAKISNEINNLHLDNPQQYENLGDVMHYATLRGVDPARDDSNKVLNHLWSKLDDKSKALYEKMRDLYENNYKEYKELLMERVEKSGAEGSVDDPSTPKGKLAASIRNMFEQSRKETTAPDGTKYTPPYFPLMRYGQYWTRIGSGANREFYMFESAYDRNMFLARRVRQMQANGDKRDLRTMMEDQDIQSGDDMQTARQHMANTSEYLKAVFKAVDDSIVRPAPVVDDFGNAISTYSITNPDAFKDEIYQLMLQTLPDKSFRKQFIHRQGVTGFSQDINRNFAASTQNMANQLARLKYIQPMLDSVQAAQDALVGNPDQEKLGQFVTEMRLRVENEAYPSSENSLGYKTAAFANKSAFLYMMTTVKTAIAQFSAIPVFAAPVLASKHGVAATAKELGSFLNVFNNFGVMHEDEHGNRSFVAPTIAASKNIKLNAEERRAAQYLQDRGIAETTMAYDLGNRRKTPTHILNSPARRVMSNVGTMMTGLFHHTERMIREVTFMTSFRLYRKANPNMSFEEVAKLAEKDTYTALGNYASINRPRGILATAENKVILDAHKPLGRAVLQFKMFPAFVTTYFVRNFGRMIDKNMTPQERKQAAMQFWGSLVMSGTLAGYMGIPGMSLAMGIAQGLRNMLRDDDDDPIEERDLELWFRNKWLPETFGNVKIGDHSMADLMNHGVISALTGYDITSSLSLNNMWFPDQKEQATNQAAMQQFALSLMGPSASLAVNQIPGALDKLNQGHILQGVEQLLPGMLRSPVTAYRYSQEGAKTSSGATLKEADEYTAGQLLAQAAGFATEGLVAQREAIFKLNQLKQQVKQEKTKLMARLDDEMLDDGDVDRVMDKIINFNMRNPFDPIDSKSISASLKKQLQQRYVTDRGFFIDKKYYPQLMDLLAPSSTRLDTESKK